MNTLYSEFEDILKNDNLSAFKAFYKKYIYNFDNVDYSLIVKYNAKKILDFYLKDSLNEESIYDFKDILEIENVYKYLALNTDLSMFNKLKEQLLKNFYENVNDDNRHPYERIAEHCVSYNSNIKLFEFCIQKHRNGFRAYQYIHNSSIEFLKVILKYYNSDESIKNITIFCNEEQLDYLIANYKEYFKECLSDTISEAIIKESLKEEDSELQSSEKAKENLKESLKEDSKKDTKLILINSHELHSKKDLKENIKKDILFHDRAYIRKIAKIFQNINISFNYIKSHFRLDVNVFKRVFSNLISTDISLEIIEGCFEICSLEDIKNNLENELLELFREKYLEIFENESLRNKFDEVFKHSNELV